MVLDKEEKPDVFAPFQLGEDVQDTENKLLEKKSGINQNPSKVITKDGTPKEDIYKQFRLSDIVKENEQRQHKQQAKKINEEQHVAAVKSTENLIWKLLPKRLINYSKLQQKFESSDERRKEEDVAEDSVKSDSSFFAAAAAVAAGTADTAAAAANPITDVLGSQFYWEILIFLKLSRTMKSYNVESNMHQGKMSMMTMTKETKKISTSKLHNMLQQNIGG
jgi:hypothetical protein